MIAHHALHIGDSPSQTFLVPETGRSRPEDRDRWRRTLAGRGNLPMARRGWAEAGNQPPWRGPERFDLQDYNIRNSVITFLHILAVAFNLVTTKKTT